MCNCCTLSSTAMTTTAVCSGFLTVCVYVLHGNAIALTFYCKCRRALPPVMSTAVSNISEDAETRQFFRTAGDGTKRNEIKHQIEMLLEERSRVMLGVSLRE